MPVAAAAVVVRPHSVAGAALTVMVAVMAGRGAMPTAAAKGADG